MKVGHRREPPSLSWPHMRASLPDAMLILRGVAVAFVALLHVGFLILEMFLWTKPFGLKTFAMTPETAATTKSLAANQGLYNGFLVAGLLWGIADGADGRAVEIFFLACVIVAGIFGALT